MASEKNSGERRGFWASFSRLKNARGDKWANLALVFVFLGAGGFAAWFLMKNAAHKLAGGAKYVRLTDSAASYGAEPGAGRERDFFASEEELAKADPSLKRELLDTSAAAGPAERGTTRTSAPAPGGAAGAAAAAEAEAPGGYAGAGRGGAAAQGHTLEAGLGARGGGLGRMKVGSVSKTGELAPAQGTSAVSVQSAQSETGKPGRGVKGGLKTSVMTALKSAFKMNLQGARLASNDSARVWIARTFDANQESRYSLAYDEKMKAQLDRINPNSIPRYLRDQSLDAASARSLGASEVGKPGFDKDATKEALKTDKDYQSQKDGQELAKALFNPLGLFGGSGKPPAAGTPPPDSGPGVFSDPEAVQTFRDVALEDFIATEGYGAECGCTAAAPCCCLPPNAADQQCPMYGPFKPDDPCAAGLYGPAGDFPAPGPALPG